MLSAYILSDVPKQYLDGSLREGDYVRRYLPPFHRTNNMFQIKANGVFGFDLKSLTKFRYNYSQKDIFSLFNSGKALTQKEKDIIRFNTLPVDPNVVHYACDDAYLCLQLHEDQMARIQEDPFLPQVYTLEMETASVVVDMTMAGVSVDWEGIKRQKEIKNKFVDDHIKLFARKKFEEETGTDLSNLNFNSPPQMAKLIYGKKKDGGLGLTTTRRTNTGALSTDETTLNNLSSESAALRQLLLYRRASKMGKWFDQWDEMNGQYEDNKIHPSFSQTTVASGRFASSGPNVQQITKNWWYQSVEGSIPEVMNSGKYGEDYWNGNARDYIVASEGYTLLSFDYKSAEVQFLAALSQELSIIEAFRSGEDFHTWTASVVFGKSIGEVTPFERQAAKSVTFRLAYGGTAKGLAEQLGVSVAEAQKIESQYFERFPQLAGYFAQQEQMADEISEVRTWLGRKITLWEAMNQNPKVRSGAARLSVNAPIQGGATGDYVKLAMVRVRSVLKSKGWWGDKVKLLMNQHDSLVFEVHNSLDLQEVIEVIEPAVRFSLKGMQGMFNEFQDFPPMDVDWEAGYRWGSMVDVEDLPILKAKSLDIVLSETATRSDLRAMMDVLVTNPGDVPVTFRRGDDDPIELNYFVKPHPYVTKKLKNGDPDIGINHSIGERISAEFVL